MKRLLIVEDDPAQLGMLKHMLRGHYDLTAAATFEEGLAAAQTSRFDLLLIDINLGGPHSGIDLLKRLRQMATYRLTPALAFTAHRELALRVSFLEQGFDGYLFKPVTKQVLLGTLEALHPISASAPEHPMRTIWRQLASLWHRAQPLHAQR